jgi:hypothetical protein
MIDDLLPLAERLPVPDAGWHPHAALIRAVRDELLADLERLRQLPDAEERLTSLLGVSLAPRPGSALAALPVPEGQHPYLDEILPALEAARLVQGALSAVTVAA